jgi:hypothetical protein
MPLCLLLSQRLRLRRTTSFPRRPPIHHLRLAEQPRNLARDAEKPQAVREGVYRGEFPAMGLGPVGCAPPGEHVGIGEDGEVLEELPSALQHALEHLDHV